MCEIIKSIYIGTCEILEFIVLCIKEIIKAIIASALGITVLYCLFLIRDYAVTILATLAVLIIVIVIFCYIKRDAIFDALDSVFEAGFRNQCPMDFMFCLTPVINLLEGNGYEEVAVYNEGSENPSVLMRNEETKSVIHIYLHAPYNGQYTYKVKDESLGHHLFEEIEFEDVDSLTEFLKVHGMKEFERTYEENPAIAEIPFPESSDENSNTTNFL